MSEALTPCPLCGEELIHRVTHFDDGSNDLHTAYCHCGFSFADDCSNDEFIKLCNRRSPVWTPCDKGLPDEEDEYDVTVCRITQGKREYISTTATYDPNDDEDCWCVMNYSDGPVVAWKKLSEPYNPNKAQEDAQ